MRPFAIAARSHEARIAEERRRRRQSRTAGANRCGPESVLEEQLDSARRRVEPERRPVGFARVHPHLAAADVDRPAPRVLDAHVDRQRIRRRVLGNEPGVKGRDDRLDERPNRRVRGDLEHVHGGNVARPEAAGCLERGGPCLARGR